MIDSKYDTVIGLETHVQLATRTKMFCGCENRYGADPNTLVCPVCLGLPGALPVVNRRSFELAMRAGLALSCKIAPIAKFDRKQYFYPDLPKAYQISQFDLPINHSGRLDLTTAGKGQSVGITRAHLEEDAGKNNHEDDATLVDLNRCGVPLLEIVTEPDIDSPEMAYDYLVELKLLLRHLGVSDCDMEKGSLRCDVNISLKPKGRAEFGTKIELKNLNSFKMVRRAIEFEQKRQSAVLDGGGTLDVEETRTWDDDKGESRLMRTKEQSADYRYFPDPDLPPFEISRAWVDEVRAELPELPTAKRARYVRDLGLPEYDAGVLVQDKAVAVYFEKLYALCGDAKKASNWIGSKVLQALNDTDGDVDSLETTPEVVAELIAMTEEDMVNLVGAQKIFDAILADGGEPRALAKSMKLVQMSDADELRDIVSRAMAANPQAVEDLRAGKKKAGGAILGWVMRETKGAANPGMVNALLAELL